MLNRVRHRSTQLSGCPRASTAGRHGSDLVFDARRWKRERLKLRIDVGVEPDADAAELDEATMQLRSELLELDVEDVERPTAGPPPPGARAAEVALLGTLLVTAGQEVIRALGRVLGDWLSRGAKRTIKLQLDNDIIELTSVSEEDQQRLLDAFLARHTAGSG